MYKTTKYQEFFKKTYEPENAAEKQFYFALEDFLDQNGSENCQKNLSRAYFELNKYLLDFEQENSIIWAFCLILEALDNAKTKETASALVDYLNDFLMTFDEEKYVVEAIKTYLCNDFLKKNEIKMFLKKFLN